MARAMQSFKKNISIVLIELGSRIFDVDAILGSNNDAFGLFIGRRQSS